MLDRWKKLHKDLYNAKTDAFDLSKVPDVHDNIRCVLVDGVIYMYVCRENFVYLFINICMVYLYLYMYGICICKKGPRRYDNIRCARGVVWNISRYVIIKWHIYHVHFISLRAHTINHPPNTHPTYPAF